MHDSKRFGRYPDDNNNEKSRPHDYSKDPKFNQKAAVKEQFDFYNSELKKDGIEQALERGEQARKKRGH